MTAAVSTQEVISVRLPLKTVSESNAHTHWRERQKRAKSHRFAAQLVLTRFVGTFRDWLASGGIVIHLTRIGPRRLDSDNLQGSQKHVRDGVADAIGEDDGSERLEWVYSQEQGKAGEYAVLVTIRPRVAA